MSRRHRQVTVTLGHPRKMPAVRSAVMRHEIVLQARLAPGSEVATLFMQQLPAARDAQAKRSLCNQSQRSCDGHLVLTSCDPTNRANSIPRNGTTQPQVHSLGTTCHQFPSRSMRRTIQPGHPPVGGDVARILHRLLRLMGIVNSIRSFHRYPRLKLQPLKTG